MDIDINAVLDCRKRFVNKAIRVEKSPKVSQVKL